MSQALKNKIIDEIIRVEGGFVDDPSDSGGATNFGITVAVARANGFEGPMQALPRHIAFDIYARKYWHKVNADELAKVSEALAEEVVDTAVNMGTTRAGLFLQKALNALNDRGRLYPDLHVDGDIGPGTLRAVRSYAATRNVETLVKACNCLQGAFYIELTQTREKDERFLYGWLNNRVKL